MTRRDPQRTLDVLFQRIIITLCWGLAGTQALLMLARLIQGLRLPIDTAMLIGPGVVALIAVAAAILLRRMRPSRRATDSTSALVMILLDLHLAVVQAWIHDPTRLFNFVIVLVVAGVFQRSRRLYLLVLGITCACLAFGWSRTPFAGTTAVLAASIFGVAALIGALVHVLVNAMVNRIQHLLTRLMSAQERIGRLEDLIPICSHCKKMRNDAGYWEQVETYLGSRTQAAFTHGICPGCMVEHFPEVAG